MKITEEDEIKFRIKVFDILCDDVTNRQVQVNNNIILYNHEIDKYYMISKPCIALTKLSNSGISVIQMEILLNSIPEEYRQTNTLIVTNIGFSDNAISLSISNPFVKLSVLRDKKLESSVNFR